MIVLIGSIAIIAVVLAGTATAVPWAAIATFVVLIAVVMSIAWVMSGFEDEENGFE